MISGGINTNKHVWEYVKKDIQRILNKEGIIDLFGRPYFRFGRSLLKKQEKHEGGKIPREEIQHLLENYIKKGLDEKILKRIIGLTVGSYP